MLPRNRSLYAPLLAAALAAALAALVAWPQLAALALLAGLLWPLAWFAWQARRTGRQAPAEER